MAYTAPCKGRRLPNQAAGIEAMASDAKTRPSKWPAWRNRQKAMEATTQFIHKAPGLAWRAGTPKSDITAR